MTTIGDEAMEWTHEECAERTIAVDGSSMAWDSSYFAPMARREKAAGGQQVTMWVRRCSREATVVSSVSTYSSL